MQTPPSKRSLQFGSPSPSSQSPSNSKKSLLMGYVLDVSAILKGYYFYIQLQNEASNVVQIPVYNEKIHQTFMNFGASGDPVKIEVYMQDDGSMRLSTHGHAYPASLAEVGFSLNSSLKQKIQIDKVSRPTEIKNLRKINIHGNKEKFTLRGRIDMGPEEAEEIDTTFGTKKIKKDIEIIDITGKVEFHVFSNRLNEMQNGLCYELTSLTLNDYGGTHMRTTRESSITLIEQIEGLPPPSLKPSASQTYTIVGFDSYTNERIFYYCKKCRKEIPIVDEQNIPDWIVCPAYKCNTRTRTRNLKIYGACDVNFVTGKDEDLWVAVLPKIMEVICGGDPIKSLAQIIGAVEKVGECDITVEKGKVEEIRFANLENKENNGNNKK